MKLEENALKGFEEQININNTLTGGVASTKMDLRQDKNAYTAHFYTPSVTGEAFKMILEGNSLIIYALLKTNEKIVPKFVQAFPIPHFVDTDNIKANAQNGFLTIHAPFKEGMTGTSQELPINFE